MPMGDSSDFQVMLSALNFVCAFVCVNVHVVACACDASDILVVAIFVIKQ